MSPVKKPAETGFKNSSARVLEGARPSLDLSAAGESSLYGSGLTGELFQIVTCERRVLYSFLLTGLVTKQQY